MSLNLDSEEKIVRFQNFCGLKWKTENNELNCQTKGNTNDAFVSTTTQHYEYKAWLHILLHVSSALGDEQILIALLSFIFWNFDPGAVMRVYICLAVSLYFGQGAKDVFMIERPKSPPVIRVEKKYAEEYSYPSTHAMMGMVVPFSLLYYTYDHFQYNTTMAVIIATICCSLVALSRVYLGMHSFKDIIVGLLFETVILAVTFPSVDNFELEKWCQTSSNTISTALFFPLMLLFIYPTSTAKSYNTYSDTALVLGIISGCLIALKYAATNQKLMLSFLLKTQTLPLIQVIGLYFLRFVTGTILLSITRVIMKWLVTTTLRKFMPSFMIMKPLGYKRFIEVPHKFITYGMVAFNCVYLAPKVFKLAGI